MKKIIFVVLLMTTFLLSSCSIYEDVYFKKDGQVTYSIQFDGSEMMAMMPNLADSKKIPTDSLIAFTDIIKEKIDLANASDEDKKDFESLSPFFLKVVNNEEKKILFVNLYGDFKNVDALNNALTAINRQQQKSKDKSTDMPLNIDKLTNLSLFEWDGKVMKRMYIDPRIETDNFSDQEDNVMEKGASDFLSQGQMIVRYHFPSKVASVDNADAMLSQDGKTVILQYSGSKFTDPDNSTDIEITITK